MKAILGAVLCFCFCVGYGQADRIWENAKINGKPVRLIFDTGCDFRIVILSTAAKQLGIQYTPPNYKAKPGLTAVGETELCSLIIDGNVFLSNFPVIEVPFAAAHEEAGLIGWGAVRSNLVSIDAVAHKLSLNVELPGDIGKWQKFRLEKGLNILSFILPLPDGCNGIVQLDTGTFDGIKLAPELWSRWKSTNQNYPLTLEAGYMPGAGFYIKEEGWADKIRLGRLEISQVAVSETCVAETATASPLDAKIVASLGMAALKRLDIIVDGINGFIYLRPKNTTPQPYKHNRLGADFIPRDVEQDDLVVHVIKGSPAYEAGVRDGDILLKEGNKDVTHWRTDTNRPPDVRLVEQPAGTMLKLTLKRGDKIFETTATLRNILPPDAATNSSAAH